MNQVRRLLSLVTMCAVATLLNGCLEQRGGGISNVTIGAVSKTYAYGWSEEELRFIIFSDIGGVASGGSSWNGYISSKDGTTVNYRADPDGVDINGTKHNFKNGRVFLVATKSETIIVEQLDIPVGATHYKEELDSIQRRKEIRDFLSD
ncbi:MAG: hypothetical protein ACON4O_09010 [Lentimonas sp.]